MQMGPIGCPEKSVKSYQHTLSNFPEEQSLITPPLSSLSLWLVQECLKTSRTRLVKPTMTPDMRVICDGITLFCSAVNKSRRLLLQKNRWLYQCCVQALAALVIQK